MSTIIHTVERWDTCWDLSQKYGVPVKEIQRLNPGVDWRNLKVGRELIIKLAQAKVVVKNKAKSAIAYLQLETEKEKVVKKTRKSINVLFKELVNPGKSVNIGYISQKYESSGKWVDTISSGENDPGGVSYGAHQLASKTGTMEQYLQSKEAESYSKSFRGMKPGTHNFNKKYREIATRDPVWFAKSQKEFITRTHYVPVLKYATEQGWSTNDPKIKEVLYSIGVQHAWAKIIVKNAGKPDGKTVEQQVRMLFKARKEYVGALSKIPASTKKSLLNRYEAEMKDVLEIFK